MAMVEKAVVLLMMIMVAAQVSNAAVYKVGDSAGWTTMGNVNYMKWAADKNFQIGDTIVFEYNAQYHNVMRVNRTMYKSCDASAPFKTFTTGNDSIRLTKGGHHFFLCGVPGHCQIGQKVDINIKVPASAKAPKVSPSAPAPTISPSAWASPVPVASPVPNAPSPSPSPSPSNASPLNVGKGAFGFVGLAMTVFSIFCI
ncbi:hypothetical protein TSUD_116130 [Trifolium subterraneum]|uniref:Phytocyanin domain-containing protein n=1 Tax=Trifolium subterraneum TaxID=3900 RepID=A0A2Z6N0F8_TRISU|nr:hypothetical protein TSUD_116130 [Trifolium subterraneum]